MACRERSRAAACQPTFLFFLSVLFGGPATVVQKGQLREHHLTR